MSNIYSSALPCQTFTAQHCHWDIYSLCSHVRHLQISVPMSDIYRPVFPCQTFTAQHFHVRHLPISVPMSDIYRSVFLCQTFTVQHCHVWHLHNPPHMHIHTHTHTHIHIQIYTWNTCVKLLLGIKTICSFCVGGCVQAGRCKSDCGWAEA